MLIVYGGFGITMFPMVNFFYGPDSVVAYFTEVSEFQTFFAQTVGLLFIMVTPAPWVFGVPFDAACKQYLVWNSLSLIMFYQAAFNYKTAGPGVNAILPFNLWYDSENRATSHCIRHEPVTLSTLLPPTAGTPSLPSA